jgi:hypothetical protein
LHFVGETGNADDIGRDGMEWTFHPAEKSPWATEI